MARAVSTLSPVIILTSMPAARQRSTACLDVVAQRIADGDTAVEDQARSPKYLFAFARLASSVGVSSGQIGDGESQGPHGLTGGILAATL